MKCVFSRLLYPRSLEEARDGSYMIALFRPRETVLDMQGNELSMVKVVGYYLPTSERVQVNLTGHWKKDAKYGLQFEMESYEEVIAPGRKGMVAYLSSGLIRGIGKKLAERIYDTFGDSTLQILDNQPDRIQEVPGIGAKKSSQVQAAYIQTRGARKVIALLAPLDVSAAQAIQLQKLLDANAEEMLRHQPFQLFEKGFIGYELADRLAASNGIPKTSPERVAAALLHVLKLAEQKGHLSLHKEQFVRETVQLLNTRELTRRVVAIQAHEMLQAGRLILYREYVYRPISARAEQETAERIQAMLSRDRLPYMGDLDDEIDFLQKELGITLAPEQRRAVKAALTSPLCVISGGPGTGKTMIQRFILGIFTKAFPNAEVICCAPTGRASRRMSQSTGFTASTVHKALGLTGEITSLISPQFLDADLVLVDEVSMLDMFLTWHLFQALRPDSRLVLVGDADQLPSVGPGAVLSELTTCGKVPVVMLDKVFRQSEGSRIAENAQAIRRGESDLDYDDDFQFWNSPNLSQSADWLEQFYVQQVKRFGVDNVALLTPFRKKTETGVWALNKRLREKINPPSPGKPELTIGQRLFRLGDKVMQTRNREEASNGDIGYICEFRREGGDWCVEVDFGNGRTVAYESTEELSRLELAYATTIHKAQGSEYDAVLISLQNAHGRMLKRPLVYTAITRAKTWIGIVGDWAALEQAIYTTDTEQRNTLLAARIAELVDRKDYSSVSFD